MALEQLKAFTFSGACDVYVVFTSSPLCYSTCAGLGKWKDLF